MSTHRDPLAALAHALEEPARALGTSWQSFERSLQPTSTPTTATETTPAGSRGLGGFFDDVGKNAETGAALARGVESVVAHMHDPQPDFTHPGDGLRALGTPAEVTGDAAVALGGVLAPGTFLGDLLAPFGGNVLAQLATATGEAAHVIRDALALAGAFADFVEESNDRIPEVSANFITEGLALPWEVREARVTEALHEPYEAVVEVVCKGAVPTEGLAGRRAALYLWRGNVLGNALPGVLRAVEDLGSLDGKRHLRATLVASLWRLSLRRTSRIFQELTAREIVDRVLDEAGLYLDGARDWQTAGVPFARRECCVQYQESDLDFIARLLQEEGISFAVTGGFVLGEQIRFFESCGDAPAVAFLRGSTVSVRADERSVLHEECVRRFDQVESMCGDALVTRDYNFTAPATLEHLTERRAEGRGASDETFEYPGRYHFSERHNDPVGDHLFAYHQNDARRIARVRFEELRSGHRVARGEATVLSFRPGDAFALDNLAHDEPGQARFALTRVEHVFEAPEVVRAEAAGSPTTARSAWLAYHNRFECVPVKAPYRPARTRARPVIHGVQTAVVVGPARDDDPAQREDIHVDTHGRVKVRFHWDRAPRAGGRRGPDARDDGRSAWIRVAQLAAGAWRGSMFVPRRGEEVVVAFLDGDPDRPLIVGSVYNGTNRPRYAVEDPRHRATSWISTQSTPGDDPERRNELGFDDRAGHERLWLRAQGAHEVTVLGRHTTAVGGAQRVTVAADREVEVRGDESRAVAGTERLAVEGDRSVRVGGAQTTRVGAEATVEVGSACSLKAASASVRVDGGAAVALGAAIELQQGASTAVIDAARIEFRCGPSSIVMTPAGVVVAGPVVKVG